MKSEALQGQLSFWGREEPEKPEPRLPPMPPLRQPDAETWLRHEADCSHCHNAYEHLLLFRRGEWLEDPFVPCPEGLRLLPMEELQLVVRGFPRDELPKAIARLRAHADRVYGLTYENMHAGVAWRGGPIFRDDEDVEASAAV